MWGGGGAGARRANYLVVKVDLVALCHAENLALEVRVNARVRRATAAFCLVDSCAERGGDGSVRIFEERLAIKAAATVVRFGWIWAARARARVPLIGVMKRRVVAIEAGILQEAPSCRRCKQGTGGAGVAIRRPPDFSSSTSTASSHRRLRRVSISFHPVSLQLEMNHSVPPTIWGMLHFLIKSMLHFLN